MGLFFHETLSPREGLFGERRHPAVLREAARATKQREGRSNDVSDNDSEDTCPGILATDESDGGSGECTCAGVSALTASAVHALRRGTLGGIFICLAPQQPYSKLLSACVNAGMLSCWQGVCA